MKEQMPLDHILRSWATAPNATVAARRLGLSRRTLYYRIDKASLAELRDAFGKLQAEAEAQLAAVQAEAAQSLLVAEGRLADLTRQLETLRREHDAIARDRAALARENDALRAEVQRLTWERLRQTHRRGDTDDPYALLHVSRHAPPEVIEAAYRALAKRYHPDVGGSEAAMKQLNRARDMILHRNGHPR
jgi:DnaJ-domain-containing protein 1